VKFINFSFLANLASLKLAHVILRLLAVGRPAATSLFTSPKRDAKKATQASIPLRRFQAA